MVEDIQKKENLEEKVKSKGALSFVLRKCKEQPAIPVVAAIFIAGTWLLPQLLYTMPRTSQVKERYQQLQAQYGDTNRDGSISPEEKNAFDKDLFRGHEGVLRYTHLTCIRRDQNESLQCHQEDVPSLRYSSTGKEVPPEKVLEWMNEYKPAHR